MYKTEYTRQNIRDNIHKTIYTRQNIHDKIFKIENT